MPWAHVKQRGQSINTCTVHTFLFTFEQLERCHDMQDGGHLRILTVLLEQRENPDSKTIYEDLYVTMVDCSPQQATLLYLL